MRATELTSRWRDFLSSTRLAVRSDDYGLYEWRFCTGLTGFIVDDPFLSTPDFTAEKTSNVGERFTWLVSFSAALAGKDALLNIRLDDPEGVLYEHFISYESSKPVPLRLRYSEGRFTLDAINAFFEAEVYDASAEADACRQDVQLDPLDEGDDTQNDPGLRKEGIE